MQLSTVDTEGEVYILKPVKENGQKDTNVYLERRGVELYWDNDRVKRWNWAQDNACQVRLQALALTAKRSEVTVSLRWIRSGDILTNISVLA